MVAGESMAANDTDYPGLGGFSNAALVIRLVIFRAIQRSTPDLHATRITYETSIYNVTDYVG
jgi:hypothetical protein